MLARLRKMAAIWQKHPRRKSREIARPFSLESLDQRICMHGESLDVHASPPALVGPAAAGDSASPAARIINGTSTSDFPSVGLVGDAGDHFCSGTLIAPRYVLTAAHCAEGLANTAGRFVVGGETYATSRVIVHPGYNPNSLANDLAIFELSQPVTGVTPSPIYRGTPRVGEPLTLVGFGGGGTGNSGTNGDFGIKRVGTTPIDGVEPTLITWEFDNNSEANTAPGDSGGPAFLRVNNVYYVAGVTSGGTLANAGLGDHSYDTRVDAYQGWIDSIVGNDTPPPPQDDHVNSPSAAATRVTLSNGQGSATGILEQAGDRDFFQFALAKSGIATISLTGQGNLDTYLRVYDAGGNQIAENDDSGGGTNSQVRFNAGAGTYYLSAAAYQDAGVGSYTLGVNVIEENKPFDGAAKITLSGSGSGRATGAIAAGSRVVFEFVATKSGSMTLNAKRTAGRLDTVLSVYDSQGNLVRSNDDYGSSTNSRVTLDRVATGERYYAVVEGYGSTTGRFKLSITTSARSRSIHSAAAAREMDYAWAVDEVMSGWSHSSRRRSRSAGMTSSSRDF